MFTKVNDYEAFKKAVIKLKDANKIDDSPKELENVHEAANAAYVPNMAKNYVDGLMKFSEQWIAAYTEKYCYMGISLIGRVEASHSSFKRVIETASDSRDLQTVFNQIDCHMKQQHLKTRRAQQKNRIAADPFTARNPRHAELVGPVSK